MVKNPLKSNGIFLILPIVRDPSTSEREHVHVHIETHHHILIKENILLHFSSIYINNNTNIGPLYIKTYTYLNKQTHKLPHKFVLLMYTHTYILIHMYSTFLYTFLLHIYIHFFKNIWRKSRLTSTNVNAKISRNF